MFDTIIIGAGIAGLAAGQCLIENDQSNFIVLECDNSIGGRVRTIEFQGKTFATGPGWIHGRKGNPIYDLAQKLGIEIEECTGDDQFFVWDVKEKKDITELFDEKATEFENIFECVFDKIKDININPELSMFDVLKTHSEEFSNIDAVGKFVSYATKEIYMGASLKEVSGRVIFQLDKIFETKDEKRNFRIIDPLGITKMVDHIAENFRTKIEYNCKVDSIFWDSENHCATVVTTDNREFKGKNVIITLQSHLLANNAIKFVPAIPTEKISAWKHIFSVNYCRIFAKFSRKFWPDKDGFISVNTDSDPFDELVLWQNYSKQNLTKDGDDNILICHYTSGYNRGSSRFDVDKEVLMDLVTESMKNMFPLTYCRPDDVLFVTHWGQDRFSGSFSVAGPGMDDAMIDMLDKSIGPLHFAGESVSIELMGTMQAAYVTGRKAAKFTMN